jgi:hypothetical protein
MLGQDVAVGDAVNVAARLEQAAGPGQVLIGAGTWRLVRDAVTVEPAGQLALKGKQAPVAAFRLLGVAADRPGRARGLDTPLVGRAAELAALGGCLDHVVAASSGRLVLVSGQAGVGKSRLLHEFTARAGEQATVLRGRCREYGDAVTYRPVADIVAEAAGLGPAASKAGLQPAEAAPEAALAALFPGDERAGTLARQLAGLFGRGQPVSARELPWAVRRLLAALAASRPVVAVLDDLHWAEPALLDLVDEVVAGLDAPVLVCGIGRPELLEARPAWADGPRLVALEPFGEGESALLVGHLLGRAELPQAARQWLWRASGGNPLFLEELVAELVDAGILAEAGGRWTATADLAGVPAPATVSALLAARIERLAPGQRSLLELASVVGEVFDEPALLVLAPERAAAEVSDGLAALGQAGLLRPGAGAGWRFRHGLLRDAAYAAMPKRHRAELHERLAAWLERGGARGGAELVGAHLERAWRLLGQLGQARGDLAAGAAAHLAEAGRLALGMDDALAASSLLGRAADLAAEAEPPDPATAAATLLDLGDALAEAGRRADAALVIERAAALAAGVGAGGAALLARAGLSRRFLEEPASPPGWAAAAEASAAAAVAAARAAGDEVGVANGMRLLAHVCTLRLRWAELERVGAEIVALAGRAGDPRSRNRMLGGMAAAIAMGPTPADAAAERCAAILAELDSANASRATVMTLDAIAVCHAMAGRAGAADEAMAGADALRTDLAGTLWKVGGRADFKAMTLVLLGRLAEAEEVLRQSWALLSGLGERGGPVAVQAAMLAQVLFAQGGRDAEAGRFAAASAAAVHGDHLLAQVHSARAVAMATASQGDAAGAAATMRAAIDLAEPTDSLPLRGLLWVDLAAMLARAGRPGEAGAAAGRAAALLAAKGDLVDLAAARAYLPGDAQPAP